MEDKKICNRCDTRNTLNARYCSGCGYELPKPVVENASKPKPVYYQTKDNSKVLLFVIGALIGLSILVGVSSIFITYSYLKNPIPVSFKNEIIVAFVNEANKQCPTMIDNMTRLDNVAVISNSIVQYNYTLGLETSQVDTVEFKRQMKISIINNIKSTKTQPTMMLIYKNGITFRYFYKDTNGEYICILEIKPEQYK